jgi:hypothetical protein
MSIFKKYHKWGTRFTIALIATMFSLGTGACKQGEEGSVQSSKDPWTSDQLINSEELAEIIGKDLPKKQKEESDQPILLHVGFPALYEVARIPGSIYTKPASRKDGIEGIRKAVQNLSLDKEIILYCGCCPWKDCPNIRPAFEILQGEGFTETKVLYLPNDLEKDWFNRGFPIEMGE